MIKWKDKLVIGEGSWGIMIYGCDKVVQLCNLLYVIWKLEVLKRNTKDWKKKKKKKLNEKIIKHYVQTQGVSIKELRLSQYLSICQDVIQQFGCWLCPMWC
jgi:hypothetical protein